MTQNNNTLISTHATDQEAVDRQQQLGVRFPDGQIIWAKSGEVDAYGKAKPPTVEWSSRVYWIDPTLDGRTNTGSYSTFRGLVIDYGKKCVELGVPVSNIVRIKREVVVVYGVATIDKAGDEFDV